MVQFIKFLIWGLKYLDDSSTCLESSWDVIIVSSQEILIGASGNGVRTMTKLVASSGPIKTKAE